jgi:hypothetical protein
MPLLETFANASARGLGAFLQSAPPFTYELIETVVLGSTTSSVTFSSIPQTYKHLQIRYSARGAGSQSENYARLRINGSSSSYRWHNLVGLGGNTIISNTDGTQDSIQLPVVPGATDTANAFGVGIIDILDYATTTKNKTIKTSGGVMSVGNFWVSFTSSLYQSTAAITNFTFYTVNGTVVANSSIATGSRISLYGIRG